MKKLKLILGIVLLNCSIGIAQSTLHIKVTDSISLIAIPNCTLNLLSLDGERKINSDEKLLLTNGMYYIELSHISYENKRIKLNLTKDTLLSISLNPQGLAIEEVRVDGERPVSFEKGNIILRPTKLYESQNMWEVIKNSGYVEATENGELQVRQKKSTVYINNRKLHLSGQELKNQLQAMPANSIQKIEVIPNPDASFASDELTVVRIITADADYVGYRVNIASAVSRGKATANNQFLKLDYANQKYDIQGSISRNITANKSWSAYNYDLGKSHWDIHQNSNNKVSTYTSFMLFNYYPNQRNNLSIYLDFADANNTSAINASNMSNNIGVDTLFNRSNTIAGRSRSMSFNSTYTLKNDSGNSVLKLQFDLLKNKTRNSSELQRDFYQQEQNDFRSELIRRNVIQGIFKSSYSLATKNAGAWLTGFEFAQNQTGNPIRVVQTNNAAIEENYTYNETVFAPFIQNSWELKNTYIRASLRQEFHTGYVDDKRIYQINGLFPTILVQQKLGKPVLELSYRKSLNKPAFHLLNNLSMSTDNSAVSISGSSQIRPQINHAVDASLYVSRFQLSAGVNYHKNYISTLITVVDGKLTQQYNNFGLALPYSFIGYQRKITNNWTLKNYLNVVLPFANFKEIESTGGTLAFSNKLINTITMKNDISAEISFLYNSEFSDGYFIHEANNNLSITVQKKFTKQNLLVYVVANDILKGVHSNVRSTYQTLNYVDKGYGDIRNIKLGIFWSFGNQKVRIKEKENSSFEELQKRL